MTKTTEDHPHKFWEQPDGRIYNSGIRLSSARRFPMFVRNRTEHDLLSNVLSEMCHA